MIAVEPPRIVSQTRAAAIAGLLLAVASRTDEKEDRELFLEASVALGERAGVNFAPDILEQLKDINWRAPRPRSVSP